MREDGGWNNTNIFLILVSVFPWLYAIQFPLIISLSLRESIYSSSDICVNYFGGNLLGWALQRNVPNNTWPAGVNHSSLVHLIIHSFKKFLLTINCIRNCAQCRR